VIIPFLQAKHFKNGPRKVDLVVIHTAEIGESLAGAEALMKVCATQERVASWHYAVDADSVTQSVHELDIAFHAPGANHNGVGIELSGRARQTPEEWQDAYSFRMLELAADLVAKICARYELPTVFVPRETLKLPGAQGITTHAEVSKAFGKSTHWDPGPHFPMAHFLERVRHYTRTPDVQFR
jgi:N-acetyl-anhydromuramyl-L-alanine amidase AmpD